MLISDLKGHFRKIHYKKLDSKTAFLETWDFSGKQFFGNQPKILIKKIIKNCSISRHKCWRWKRTCNNCLTRNMKSTMQRWKIKKICLVSFMYVGFQSLPKNAWTIFAVIKSLQPNIVRMYWMYLFSLGFSISSSQNSWCGFHVGKGLPKWY
jgi:hypothetical protein